MVHEEVPESMRTQTHDFKKRLGDEVLFSLDFPNMAKEKSDARLGLHCMTGKELKYGRQQRNLAGKAFSSPPCSTQAPAQNQLQILGEASRAESGEVANEGQKSLPLSSSLCPKRSTVHLPGLFRISPPLHWLKEWQLERHQISFAAGHSLQEESCRAFSLLCFNSTTADTLKEVWK